MVCPSSVAPRTPSRELLNTLAFTGNLAQRTGDHATSIRAAQDLTSALDQAGEENMRLHAFEGLALAYSNANQPKEAEKTYEDALGRAQKLGDPSIESRVRRDHGLFLSEHGKKEAAGEMLSAALELARRSRDAGAVGEALAAYGIFIQHGGEAARARPLLEEVLKVLPPSSPTVLFARTHLKAIEESRACDCAAHVPGAITDSVKELLAGKVPAGLIKDLAVEVVKDGKPRIHVQLARAPTDEEKQLLDRAINHAMIQIQNNIREKGWGGPR